MIVLLWTLKTDADANERTICTNMGIPVPGGTTTDYAEAAEVAEGEHAGMWGYEKPEERYMTGVTGYTEADYQPGWARER